MMRFDVVDLENAIMRLRDKIRQEFGVDINMGYDEMKNEIGVDSVENKDKKSGVGGFQAMAELTHFADEHGLAIALVASEGYGKIPIESLLSFYEHFGFKTDFIYPDQKEILMIRKSR